MSAADSVHPRSVHAALHEFSRAHGGKQWPFSEHECRKIIAEVHAVSAKHNRSREIRLRMTAKAFFADNFSPSSMEAGR